MVSALNAGTLGALPNLAAHFHIQQMLMQQQQKMPAMDYSTIQKPPSEQKSPASTHKASESNHVKEETNTVVPEKKEEKSPEVAFLPWLPLPQIDQNHFSLVFFRRCRQRGGHVYS